MPAFRKQQRIEEQVEAARARYPDFDSVNLLGLNVSPTYIEFLQETEHFCDLWYFFAVDHGRAATLFAMAPEEQFVRLKAVEAHFAEAAASVAALLNTQRSKLPQLIDRDPAFQAYILAKLSHARVKFPDFDLVTAGDPATVKGLILSPTEFEFFEVSPIGADILYYLGKDRTESTRILRLPPEQQAVELSLVEAKLLKSSAIGGSAWPL